MRDNSRSISASMRARSSSWAKSWSPFFFLLNPAGRKGTFLDDPRAKLEATSGARDMEVEVVASPSGSIIA